MTSLAGGLGGRPLLGALLLTQVNAPALKLCPGPIKTLKLPGV